MKTNIKVVALALSGVFLASGLVTQCQQPKAPKVLVESSALAASKASKAHIVCNSGDAWFPPRSMTSEELKTWVDNCKKNYVEK